MALCFPSETVHAKKAFVPDLPLRGSSGFAPDSLLGACAHLQQ